MRPGARCEKRYFFIQFFRKNYHFDLNKLPIIYRLGLEVRAFVRDEAKIPEQFRDKVETMVGDVTNSEQVSKAVAGRDGVVIVLGTRNDLSMFLYSFIYFSTLL